MAFHVSSRWGGHESEPSVDRMRAVGAELDANDDEHPDVALTHDSEWCLSARGLFAYDWNWNSGSPLPTLPYRQMCRPTVPLHVSELPDDVAGYTGQVAFTSLRFSDTVKIVQAFPELLL